MHPRVLLRLTSVLLLAAVPAAFAGEDAPTLDERVGNLEKSLERLGSLVDKVQKKVDDLLWLERVGDVAEVDKVYIPTVPNPHETPRYGIENERHPFKVYCYVFVPRDLDRGTKHPWLVLPHGGVHGDFNTYYVHIVRELMAEGYVVVAPEYRGSTGYGRSFYEAIDYGGLEIEDTFACRNFMLENYEFLDSDRVGVIGWSHGGLHALMNIFEHPEAYAAAYAGVPVGDLVARMGYKTQRYRDLYSADFHIGKTAYEDVEEYKRRSPSWNTHKYQGTPLLIHTTTNDEDVNVLEVERIIQALQAEGKTGFEYKIYEDAPGGHSFNRLDTKLARESRHEIWRFLAEHLNPSGPIP